MHLAPPSSPLWSTQLADSSVSQLAGLGKASFAAVLEGGVAAVASGSTGGVSWASEDGSELAVPLGSNVLLLDGSGGAVVLKEGSSGRPGVEDLFFDRAAGGGKRAAAVSGTGVFALACGRRLLIVNQQRQVQQEVSLPPGDVTGLCWADDRLLATRTPSEEGVLCWEPSFSGPATALPESDAGSIYTCLAASQNGELAAAGSADGQVLLWKLECGSDASQRASLIQKLAHNASVEALAWDAYSQLLAVCDGASVSIWNVSDSWETARPVVCCGHQARARISCISFHSTTHLLATGGDHGQVMVYDTSSLQRGQQLEPHLRASVSLSADCSKTCVTALAWLPSGLLAAGCDDGRIVGWQISCEPPAAASAAADAQQLQSAPEAVAQAAGDVSQSPQPMPGTLTDASASLVNSHAPAAASIDQPSSGEVTYAQAHLPRSAQSGATSAASSQAGGPMPPGDEHVQHSDGETSSAAVQRKLFPAERQAAAEAAASMLAAAASEHGASPRLSKFQWEEEISAAETSSAGTQPQPPTTPETQSKSGRSKRGNRRGKSHSQTSLTTDGSSNSMPEFQQHRSMSSLNGAAYSMPRGSNLPGSAPVTPPHLSPQNSAGGWSPHAMSLHSPPYSMYYQPAHMQMGMMPGGMMLPHPSGAGQGAYMMPGQLGSMAYMQGGAPMPYFIPPGMAMGGQWAPYPHVGQDGYGMAPQAWCMPAGSPPTYSHTVPPLSVSPPAADHRATGRNISSAGQPAKGTSPRKSGATKRGSRGRGGSASGSGCAQTSSSGDSPAELSSDCSSSLKTNTSEVEGGPELATPVTTIYVGNLPPEVHEQTLVAAFSCFGPITACEVVRERLNRESRGFAFMTFAHASYAASAMVNMNGAVLYGPFRDMALRVAPSARDLQAQAQHVSSLRAKSAPAAHGKGATAAAAGGASPPAAAAPLSPEQQTAAELSASKQQHAAEQRRQLVQRARQVVAETTQASPSVSGAASAAVSPVRPTPPALPRAPSHLDDAAAAAAAAAAQQAMAGVAAVVAMTPSDADSEDADQPAAGD